MKEKDESKGGGGGNIRKKEKKREKKEAMLVTFFSSQIKIICILPGIHQHKMCFISMIAIPK